MSGDDNGCPPARILEPWEMPGAENPIEKMQRDLQELGDRLSELERELAPQPVAPDVDVAAELRAALERLDVEARARFLIAEGERAAPPEVRELVAIARRYSEGNATQSELDQAEQRAGELMGRAIEAYETMRDAHLKALDEAATRLQQSGDATELHAVRANDATPAAEARMHVAKLVWTSIIGVDPELGEDALDIITSGLEHVPGVIERARAWR